MKGPFERLKYELRRIWECPKCHHRAKSPGSQTAMFCRCSEGEPPSPMSLVSDGPRRLVPPVVLVHDPIVLLSMPISEVAATHIADPADPSGEPSAESPESQSFPEAPPSDALSPPDITSQPDIASLPDNSPPDNSSLSDDSVSS